MTQKADTIDESNESDATKSESQTRKSIRNFGDLLVNVADEIINYVFKDKGAEAIYYYIESTCHLERAAIAERPEAFSASLQKLLGSGALVIEKMILENLYCRLQLEYEEKRGFGFSDYVNELRKECSH